MIPDFNVNIRPFGVGGGFQLGGSLVGKVVEALSDYHEMLAMFARQEASQAGRLGGLIMRHHDWVLQSNLAAKEIMQFDQQIAAADLRIKLTELELTIQS